MSEIHNIPISHPWKTNSVQSCPLVDKKYVPVGYLYRMLSKDRKKLTQVWSDYIYYSVPNGNSMRNFIHLSNLAECLEMLNIWNKNEIKQAVDQFNLRSSSPPRKAFEIEEEGEEVIQEPAKRRYRAESDVPVWAETFISEMTNLVGKQAVEVYTGTEQYAEDCAKAVQDRVKDLEKELRRQVKQDLRNELRPEVENELKEEMKIASMKRFQLPMARSVFNAPSGTSKKITNDDILSKAGIFKK